MRYIVLSLAALTFLITGCTQAGVIPPQDTRVSGPEPRNMMLSEMTAELGWTYESGPHAYNYTMRSPKGDQVIFRIGSDIVNINGTRWRQENDAFEKGGRDLLLPESTFNFVCKHFGEHHLVRSPLNTPGRNYALDPLKPLGAPAKAPEPVREPSSTLLKGLTICIDAGHGGRDPGGQAHGIDEKDVCLPVSLELRRLLEDASADVIMTRVDDSYPSLDQRVNVANKARVDLFVSIHANIAPNSNDVTGFEVFYNSTSDTGAGLAQTIVNSMDTVTDSPNRGAKEDPRGLRVLEQTQMTAVLVELGFLSNRYEARWLTTDSYQKKLAGAVFEGIANYWTRNKAQVSK